MKLAQKLQNSLSRTFAGYAVQSADIAQESFDTYTKAYGIIPNDKMIIYISNQDNIANGALY